MDRLRDHRGRFKKPPRITQPPRIEQPSRTKETPRTKELSRFDLFGLPAELRSLIYTIYFSYDEKPFYSPNIRFTGSHQAYPMLKPPLLQTSSVVYAEALTIFYQSYRFKIRTPYMAGVRFPPPPDPPKVLGSNAIKYMTPLLSRITNLELEDIRMANPDEWDGMLAPYVQCLLDFCPQLRFLTLHISKHPKDWRNIFEQDYPLRKSASLLAQLWKRLDRLDVSVVHRKDTSEGFRELIAPKHCWIRQEIVKPDRYSCEIAIWSLQPTTKASDGSEQQKGRNGLIRTRTGVDHTQGCRSSRRPLGEIHPLLDFAVGSSSGEGATFRSYKQI